MFVLFVWLVLLIMILIIACGLFGEIVLGNSVVVIFAFYIC